MDEVFLLFQDSTFRLWYILIGVAVLVLPMVALAIWYHRNIGKTEGGRALMRRQNARRPVIHRDPMLAQKQMVDAGQMARDIAAGKYGTEARSMQNRVYWIMGLYVVVLVIYFGLLIWADEVNRATG